MRVGYEMSMVGDLNFFLRLQVKQVRDGIFVSKTKYAKELVKKFGLESAKHAITPMSTSIKLSRDTTDKDVDSRIYSVLSPVSHKNTPTHSHATLIFVIGTSVPIDVAYVIFIAIVSVASSRRTTVLLLGSLITRIYVGQGVTIDAADEDMEGDDDPVGGDGAATEDDHLVNHTLPQYHWPLPPHEFHPDLGVLSSIVGQPFTRGDFEELYQRIRL
ncbi:hypothetical protein F0562_007411 [Nyssa sinensis]|uniref:Reverse transcriptase Ty1/copia-type domain-containing protein n=1 Tax=Nyssa sinensis TaxID=561372 RepID=A0A5J5A6J2_9ASTE|nr:hypothetical protein F0562_007411 [Nyssa sinensis]